jgi:hypothetical protein
MMKRNMVYGPLCVLIAALVFSACPGLDGNGAGEEEQRQEEEEQQEEEGAAKKIRVTTGVAPKYYSLSTGKTVSDPRSQSWDVAFPGNREIWVNAGAAAADQKSGGQGGVWYTNETDFTKATGVGDKIDITADSLFAGIPDNGDFNYGTPRYIWGMDAAGNFVLFRKIINVISYAGYGGETVEGIGLTEDKPYTQGALLYNKRQFYYNAGTMPPNFQPTLWVYIIRHGDGVHHSKFQVTAYKNLPDVLTVKFEPLPEEE